MARILPARLLAALCLTLLCGLSQGGELHLTNRLADNPSPYLAMHGQDPVAWQGWGREAIDTARKHGRLLFVSSGYFACHWCHVMQRESYHDPEIAALLNRSFVPIKVDRELLPALDAHLIDFVSRTQGSAGWPLNVILTPEGYPLVGFTYLPPASFKRVLTRVVKGWQQKPQRFRTLAQNAAAEMASPAHPIEPLPEDAAQPVRQALMKEFRQFRDEVAGGFGKQNKFPMLPHLTALLELQRRQPSEELGPFLQLTLQQMDDQGLHDLLAGGFFRYTTDPNWQVPHFEKMLYTNALAVPLYYDAATILKQPRFTRVARETLDFILTTLASPDGGYIASLSAVDDQGVEGGAYLWRNDELNQILNADERRAVQAAWGLGKTPELEAGSLPRQAQDYTAVGTELGVSATQITQWLQSARHKMLQARAKRGLPRDTKRLAGWNGLTLSALARGAREPDGERYRQAGQKLRHFLLTRLWDGKRLKRDVDSIGQASLQDYAYVATALRDWSQINGSRQDLELARQLARTAWERFYDQRGWRLGDETLIPSLPGEATLPDGPMPSPSGTLMNLSRDLQVAPRERQEAAQRAFPVILESALWNATSALYYLQANGSQIQDR